MSFELSEDTLNTDEWNFDENANGDGVITHKSTGATLVYNSTEDQWEPSGGIATPELNGEVTANSSLTDIASSGLEIASNGLQILSSIWDSNNSEITADVNNTNTTTDTLEATNLKTGHGWVDKINSRSFDTTFTNPTSSFIIVSVTAEASANGTQINLQLVDSTSGVTIAKHDVIVDSGREINIYGRIPSEKDYRVIASGDTANFNITFWREYRV